MDDIKKERLLHEVKRHAAAFISLISNRESLITVTDVRLSKKERRAYIGISVYPKTHEEKALLFLKRHAYELHEYLTEHMRMRFLPAVVFVIDKKEEARQKFEEILKQEKSGATENDAV